MKKSSQLLRYLGIGIFATVLATSLVFRSCSVEKYNDDLGIISKNTIVGNGKIIDKQIPISEFDTLNISGKFDVIIGNGKPGTVSISGDENVIPAITITTINKVLNIETQHDISVHPKIVISNENIQAINLNGKTELHAMNINAEKLTMAMNGKSIGYIQGNMKSLEFNLNGKSELHATLPQADHISVTVNGKGTLYLTGKTKSLMITCHGKADVFAKNLVADNVIVQSTGDSEMTIHAVKSLTVQAFGKSTILYTGDPVVTKNTFGKATVTQITNPH
jgi:hypothetical protein